MMSPEIEFTMFNNTPFSFITFVNTYIEGGCRRGGVGKAAAAPKETTEEELKDAAAARLTGA